MFIVSTVLQYDNNNNLLCNCYVPVIDDFLPCTVQCTQIRNQDVIKPKTTYKFTMELNYVLFSLLALGFIKYRGNRQKKEVNSILRIFQIKLFHYMGGKKGNLLFLGKSQCLCKALTLFILQRLWQGCWFFFLGGVWGSDIGRLLNYTSCLFGCCWAWAASQSVFPAA